MREEVKRLKERFPEGMTALIPALHLAQERYGQITEEAAREIAEALGTTPEHVLSVASFYHLFHRKPVGKFHFLVCTNLSCMINGAYNVVGWLRELLGVGPGEITPDGLFSYEETECIGACDIAPAALVNGVRVGPLTRDKLRELLEKFKEEAQRNG